MGQVTIDIAGRSYQLACRDGEEEHLFMLCRMVDTKAREAAQAMGNMTENRHILVTALLLADELNDLKRTLSAPSRSAAGDGDIDMDWAADVVDRLAERIEKLAAGLEQDATSA